MNRFRKVWVVALALMLASMLLLSACNSNNNSTGEQPAAEEPTDDAQGAAEETPTEPAEPELEEYTITVFVPGVPQKDMALVNEEASKYLKEKINANLQLEIIDWGSWQDKMNLKYASNEAFDISWTTSWDSYFTRIEKGAFLPLNDLIDQYGQDAKAILHPALLEGGLYNGQNYGLPVNKEIASSKGVLLNKALVEKYNIDISTIKTLQDLEPHLKTIKENEPGVTPFLMNKDVNVVHQISNVINFEAVTDGAVVDRTTAADDLTILNMVDDPRFKEALDLTRKWYQAGYINQDAATLQDFDGAIKAGNWFAFVDSLKPGKDAEKSNSHGVPMVQVDLTQPIISTGDALGSMMSISATSENPERAMMFLNLLYTDKYLVNLLSFGIEGTHFVKKSDNIISFPEGVDASTSTYNPGAAWMFGNQFNDYLFDNENPEKWNNFKKFNDIAVPSKLLGFNMNIEPIKNEVAAYQNVFKEFTPGLYTGSVDPNEVLPQYAEKLKSIGIEKIQAEAQKQLDEWKALK